MTLYELVNSHPQSAESGVPEWMLGCFKRRSISFANGSTDSKTEVFWLQSRNLTIDLRLPIEEQQVVDKALHDYSRSELAALADYEGWYAQSNWHSGLLSWSGGCCFQLHNRWPEPAELRRVGDCMIEFAPSGAYVEDWRLISGGNGPLIGLQLLEETDLQSGVVAHRDGALIVSGNWAALVLGRASSLAQDAAERTKGLQLRDLLANNSHSVDFTDAVFNFETSVAKGGLEKGFTVLHSTLVRRKGQALFGLDGFSFDPTSNTVTQIEQAQGRSVKRRYRIDCLEPHCSFARSTEASDSANQWFAAEQQTLRRYT